MFTAPGAHGCSHKLKTEVGKIAKFYICQKRSSRKSRERQRETDRNRQTRSRDIERMESEYGVVPKGLLTFLGSLYKEVAKTTSGTLVYRFERQTARKISSFEKHCVLDLECRILSQEPSYSCILYFNVVFHGK